MNTGPHCRNTELLDDQCLFRIVTLFRMLFQDERIYVYIMKETSKKIYGGKGFHEYIILCKLPASGIIQNVTAKAVVTQT